MRFIAVVFLFSLPCFAQDSAYYALRERLLRLEIANERLVETLEEEKEKPIPKLDLAPIHGAGKDLQSSVLWTCLAVGASGLASITAANGETGAAVTFSLASVIGYIVSVVKLNEAGGKLQKAI